MPHVLLSVLLMVCAHEKVRACDFNLFLLTKHSSPKLLFSGIVPNQPGLPVTPNTRSGRPQALMTKLLLAPYAMKAPITRPSTLTQVFGNCRQSINDHGWIRDHNNPAPQCTQQSQTRAPQPSLNARSESSRSPHRQPVDYHTTIDYSPISLIPQCFLSFCGPPGVRRLLSANIDALGAYPYHVTSMVHVL